MVLATLLNRLLVVDAVIVVDHRGRAVRCGPARSGSVATLRLRRPIPLLKLLLQPSLAIGEAYMSGDLSIEKGTLRDVMALVFRHVTLHAVRWPRLARARALAGRLGSGLLELNSRAMSARNISYHYDLDAEVFELLLDPHLQYTCGYFSDHALPVGTDAASGHYLEEHALDLDDAQNRRIDQIIGKLRIARHMRVLDVGCGWGGLAIEICRRTGAEVRGITISRRQLDYARAKAVERGVAGRVTFEFCDYRDLAGRYDRITSAGVLEHIGKPHHASFIKQLASALTPDGLLLLDATGQVDRPSGTNPWLRKYIFPGGYIPALSEVTRAAETAGFLVSDIDVTFLQYALTVREWSRRLATNADRLRDRKGIEFVRMIEFYLAASEMALLHGRFMNFQILLTNSRHALPLNRSTVAPAAPQQSQPIRQPATVVRPRASQ